MNIETLRKLFRTEQVPTREFTLSCEEQLHLMLIKNHKKSDNEQLAIRMRILGGPFTFYLISSAEKVTSKLEVKGLIKTVVEKSDFEYKQITKNGKSAIRQMRNHPDLMNLSKSVVVNIPVENNL